MLAVSRKPTLPALTVNDQHSEHCGSKHSNEMTMAIYLQDALQ